MRKALLILALAATQAHAGLFDATRELEGKLVIAAGDVRSVDCPPYGGYDCSTWPLGLMQFEFKDICFTATDADCNYSCKGFIAIGKDEVPYFFQAQSIGDDIRKSSIQYYKCPSI